MKQIAKTPEQKDKPHVWEQDLFGNGELTCKVCGVTYRAMSRSEFPYEYSDAMGKTIRTLVELSCPVFIGNTEGAAAETKQRVRNLSSKVETIDERLQRLEEENQNLREQIQEQQSLSEERLTTWLVNIMQQAKGRMLEDRSILDNIIDAVYEKVEVKRDTSNDTD